MELFSIFLYTFTINCATTRARKKPIEYMFCFIYSQQNINIILSCKMCSLISSVFMKINLNNTTPTFQEVGGVTQPGIFCRSYGIALTITNVIGFYSQQVLLLLATVFN